jgi:menaquinone-dependent protoporphyrinogen IX oxidase
VTDRPYGQPAAAIGFQRKRGGRPGRRITAETGAGVGLDLTPEPAGEVSEAGRSTGPSLRILLVYATRHGSTREVADTVAGELRAAGHDVDQRAAAEAPGPAGYDAVVVGGPMIMGWHREAVRYVTAHRIELAHIPTAYFITAASLTETGENDVHGVPLDKDPWLAKAPRDAGKLRRKERYALPEHYLGTVLKKTAPARPRSVAFFAGSLDLTTMNLLEKAFVLLVVGATPGDGRNWKAIREWGGALGEALRA